MDTWWGPGRAQCCACLKWRDDVVGSPHVPRFYICHDCAWQVIQFNIEVIKSMGTGRVSAPPPGGADSAAPASKTTDEYITENIARASQGPAGCRNCRGYRDALLGESATPCEQCGRRVKYEFGIKARDKYGIKSKEK